MFDLDIIKTTVILHQEDFDFLATVSEELKDTLTKRQIFRTETEMEISVLNDIKHPTNASKYWQAVREQAVMFENLVSAGFEYRRNENRLKRLTAKMTTLTDQFDIEENQIDIDECVFKRVNMESTAKDRIREIRLWSQIKKDLDNGSFDTKDVNTHQLVSYAQRFILQASNAPRDMPVAEANNLKGQLLSSIKELEQRGILDQVLSTLPQNVLNKVLIEPGILQITPPKQN
jgi:hypothetical protein